MGTLPRLGACREYMPKDENAIFDIMNLLEDRLKHRHSTVA